MAIWNLNESNFTWIDRLKLAGFFLNPKNMWTMSRKVQEFEQKMSGYIGCAHSVFVSNGSTANTLIAMFARDRLATCDKNTVVFPSVTWITSVSPFVRLGFEPKFIDVSLDDLSLDVHLLDAYLAENHHKVALVFITSLLGQTPNVKALKELEAKYNVRVMMDNCESHFSTYEGKNLSSYFTSTTSTYFGHLLQSVEGGFVFTSNKDEQEYFTMSRNHGMIRTLPAHEQARYQNPLVDDRFSFHYLGNNFRNTDVHASVGLLDFARIQTYIKKRKSLYKVFTDNISPKYVLPKTFANRENIMFCLPIMTDDSQVKIKAMQYCVDNGIETRPIISGNLLRQTALKDFGDYHEYPVAEFIHNHGFYVGLHPRVTPAQIKTLVAFLNELVA